MRMRWVLLVATVGIVALQPVSATGQELRPLVPPAPDELFPPVVSRLLRPYEQPATPWGAGHRGVDLAVAPGVTVLRAALTGTLTTGVTVGNRWVTIEAPNGSLRATLSYLESVSVAHNLSVGSGQAIAIAGLGHGDGVVSQHHTHFSVRVPDLTDPTGWRYVDPMPYLRRYLRRVRGPVTRIVG